MCKECAAAIGRSYRAEHPIYIRQVNERYYDENRESVLAQKRDYYERNKEQIKERSKIQYRNVRDTAQFKQRSRGAMLRLKYGITHEDYERMLSEQSGVCAICKNPPTEKRPLAVDHCHKTNRVRGLLCNPCNSFLGRINDDVDKLEQVRHYLSA
jgi:hypothetical protein